MNYELNYELNYKLDYELDYELTHELDHELDELYTRGLQFVRRYDKRVVSHPSHCGFQEVRCPSAEGVYEDRC